MKKIKILMVMALLSVLLCGCNRVKQNTGDITVTPSTQPIVTLPPETVDEDTSGTDAQQNTNTLKLQDYFPIQADTEYVYEGAGNEYAAYIRTNDFVDATNNKVQTRTNNGGTETVEVIEIKDGKVSVIYTIHECYYRDNFINKTADADKIEILLMEPLVKGTEWTLPDGRKRYISAIDVDISTPSGKYKALEVTTEDKENITLDYYAPQVGVVKRIYSGEFDVTSTLSEINTDTPFTQSIDIFYPDADEKIYVEQLTLTFRTGDVTRLILQEALRQEAEKESYLPLVSPNTKINSLYLGADNIVYVDFSADLVNDMNAGSGYEALILQSITNTFGNYYGVEKVYITIDGEPYSSGHILKKKGETFKVNMDAVVR